MTWPRGAVAVATASRVEGRAGAAESNAFDLLRLLGVLLVLVHHSWVLTGASSNLLPAASGTDPGTLGVAVFFAVSGYLVTGSWLADPSPWRFAARRALRLWPLLTVVVVATALVLGPLATTLPWRGYLADPATWGYIADNLTLWWPQWSLPGVLDETGVNGSMWTLPWEVVCYLGVVVAGCLTVLRRPAVMCGFATVALTWMALAVEAPAYLASALVAFTLGVTAQHVCRWWVPTWWAVAAAGLLWAAVWGTRHAPAGSVLFVGVTVFAVAFRAPAALRHPTGRWDLSYGMYLTAYPLQQLAIVGGGWRSPWAVLVLAVGGSGAVACAAWPLVERPALRFKPRRPTPRVLEHGRTRRAANGR